MTLASGAGSYAESSLVQTFTVPVDYAFATVSGSATIRTTGTGVNGRWKIALHGGDSSQVLGPLILFYSFGFSGSQTVGWQSVQLDATDPLETWRGQTVSLVLSTPLPNNLGNSVSLAVGMDNMSVNFEMPDDGSGVPEPATFALMPAALAGGLALYRSRRQRQTIIR